jgi:hypothetical protein
MAPIPIVAFELLRWALVETRVRVCQGYYWERFYPPLKGLVTLVCYTDDAR